MKTLRELAARNFSFVVVVLATLYVLQQLHFVGVIPMALGLFVTGIVYDWASDETA